MRLVIQRVLYSKLSINGNLHAVIEKGLLVFIGIEANDSEEDINWLSGKLCQMRLFSDDDGKMNLDINQVNGELLLVSQFTLHASTKKGNRPSFINAAKPDQAIVIYEKFINATEAQLGRPCKTGVFGADMQIELLNDGPVTIFLDSKNRN
jgi:D-aminoacyl-tRNA deacylase